MMWWQSWCVMTGMTQKNLWDFISIVVSRYKSILNSFKFLQRFNQKTFSHGIYYCECLGESKVHVKYVKTVKSTT